jgi:HAD superfamily phosphoserine phosphatase-like hydrolase
VERLVERGIFPLAAREAYAEAQAQWRNRAGEYGDFIRRVVTSFATYAKGTDFEEASNVAGELIEEQKGRAYRYTRDLIQELKGQGYFLLAVSHSPKFIVDGFAYELGFDKSYGTFYATGPSDRFTGLIEDEELIMNKAAILTRAVKKEGLTLEGSVGVGDTESDIPMLEMASRPIAFNPNAGLYRHAKLRGWEVIVERKDVIYENS